MKKNQIPSYAGKMRKGQILIKNYDHANEFPHLCRELPHV